MKKDEKVRIMPLGDSITYDNDLRDCETPRPIGDRIAYRYDLYNYLRDAGYNFTFVGNRQAGENFFPETNNAGFPGCTVKQLCEILKTGFNQFDNVYEVQGKYLDIFKPDIILLHIGTNHVDETDINDFAELLDIIQEYQENKENGTCTVFVAQIIDYEDHNPAVTRLNGEIKALAENRIATGMPLILVNMEPVLDYDKDMADRFHPDPKGYAKIAKKWFETLDSWYK